MSSTLALEFSGANGETSGTMLELDEIRVIGGVVSLPLESDDDPVESFLAIFAKAGSILDKFGADILVGEGEYWSEVADFVPELTGQAKSRESVEPCISLLRALLSSGLCSRLLKRSNKLTSDALSIRDIFGS